MLGKLSFAFKFSSCIQTRVFKLARPTLPRRYFSNFQILLQIALWRSHSLPRAADGSRAETWFSLCFPFFLSNKLTYDQGPLKAYGHSLVSQQASAPSSWLVCLAKTALVPTPVCASCTYYYMNVKSKRQRNNWWSKKIKLNALAKLNTMKSSAETHHLAVMRAQPPDSLYVPFNLTWKLSSSSFEETSGFDFKGNLLDYFLFVKVRERVGHNRVTNRDKLIGYLIYYINFYLIYNYIPMNKIYMGKLVNVDWSCSQLIL